MLPGAKQTAGLLEVNVIWRANMNGSDARIFRQFVERGVRSLEAESLAGFRAALFAAAKNAAYRNSKPPQSIYVRPANKSHTDHCRRLLHSPRSWSCSHVCVLPSSSQQSVREAVCVPQRAGGKVPVFGLRTNSRCARDADHGRCEAAQQN